ncbi:hypothetical protein GOP47_0027525 [Adiantum capillus-veneris]|nr:hypothetical protein GOP47_0027525 [Adiantum capillus-veneris]
MATFRCSLADQLSVREPSPFSSSPALASPHTTAASGLVGRSKLRHSLQSRILLFPTSSSIGGDRRSRVAVLAQTPILETSSPSLKSQSKSWAWKRDGGNLNIVYEEHVGSGGHLENLLLLPTISDVSTTEEWRAVALNLLDRDASQWRIIIVDWPGFGLSDRPRMEYTADSLESFLADFVNASDSPLSSSEKPPIIIGAGHAASLAMRAVKKGLIKATAIAAVAPTWAGPMPIVFGREPDMESRYSLLRNSLQAPAFGWMMYNFMVSSPNNIRKQYLSHVYADPENVTPSLLESRLALTKREGARYAPAAFLTGLLDPVKSREEFMSLVADLDGKVPMIVLSASQAPRRSKAEMEVLNGARGVSKFVRVDGALLPQEEHPGKVSEVLFDFLMEI